MLPTRLPLKGYALWFGHYQAILVFSSVAAVILWTASTAAAKEGPFWYLFTTAAIAALQGIPIWMLWKRRRDALEMIRFRTANAAHENYQRITRLAEEQNWRIAEDDPNVRIQMHSKTGWFTWGEMITVFFTDSEVAVNCICDPTVSSPSLTSFGRNADHLQKVKKALGIV